MPDLMMALTVRRLTAGELTMAAGVFAAGLDASRVWLGANPIGDRIFTPGKSLIVWPASSAWRDFSLAGVPIDDQADLIHELTHVRQAQKGTFLLAAKLEAGDSDASYDYDLLAGGKTFPQLNIEAQAHVVEDFFLASHGQTTKHGRPLKHELAVYEAASHYWRS
jgi:hypothetical protein